jgi:hypothetical protein
MFGHFPSRYCIVCLLLVTWWIVKEKQPLGLPLSQPLKYIYRLIDLLEKGFRSEPAITILPSLEKNACVPANDLM